MEKSCQGCQKGIIEEGLAVPTCEAQTGVQKGIEEAQKVNGEAQKVNVETHADVQIADKNQAGIVKPRRGRPKKVVDATVKMLVNTNQSDEQKVGNQTKVQAGGQAKVQAGGQAKVQVMANQAKVRAHKVANEQTPGGKADEQAAGGQAAEMARVLEGKKSSFDENANVSGGDTNKLKDMIMQALDNAGGVAYLTDQALVNPNAFFGLVKSICAKSTASADTAVKGESIVIRIRGLKTK